jgi:cell division protein FtsW (lipid II flippase)
MGTGTPVTNRQEIWRRNATQIARRPLRLGIDVPLLLIVSILIVFGLLMVYSASTDYSFVILEKAPTYMFRRQLVFALLGIGLATAAAFIDYRRWQKLALPAHPGDPGRPYSCVIDRTGCQ